MAVSLVDLSGASWGVVSAETSIEVQNFSVTTAPQFKEFAKDRFGVNKGFAVSPGRQEITLDGYLTASSLGVLAFTFTTACTLANDKDYFGVSAGDVYLDTATINQTSEGLKNLSMSLSRDTEITGSGA